MDTFMRWYEQRTKTMQFTVRQVPLRELEGWFFEPDTGNLVHQSGKFFRVEGVRVTTNFGTLRTWDQPIINQPEFGILGIITQKHNGVLRFLMQAKVEPGNVNIVQLSPTLQATRSNYTQMHKGKRPHYLDYFIDRNRSHFLVDQLQPEQGSRFLAKRNRNMIVEVPENENVPVLNDFYWLTLGQIRELLLIDNFVNMDARSVLSCISVVESFGDDTASLQVEFDPASAVQMKHVPVMGQMLSGFAKDLLVSALYREGSLHTLDDIVSWFTELRTKYDLTVERIPLNQVNQWVCDEWEIRHIHHRHFSVIGVSVEANNREVGYWTQPLLKHTTFGVIGFLVKKINGVLHFLVQAKVEPGNLDAIDMAPTVSCAEAEVRALHPDLCPPFLSCFMHVSPKQIRYSAIQSEEGGRFYHFQNRYMVVEIDENENPSLPENYIWVTQRQIMLLIKHAYFNIEARSLFACLGF
jgi:oxidase EvaA